AGRRIVGVCLGAQLLAAAAGARVFKGEAGLEKGLFPIRRLDAGPLLEGVTEVVHWHQDTFDEVPGATLLASSERYRQQAFALRNCIGVQFHPELDAQAFARWFPEGELGRFERALPSMRALCQRLVDAE